MLLRLRSMGPTWSTLLVNEVFYRDFRNPRRLGAYLGLTGTPYNSGQSVREQGISRAGNARACNAALEFACLWVHASPRASLPSFTPTASATPRAACAKPPSPPWPAAHDRSLALPRDRFRADRRPPAGPCL